MILINVNKQNILGTGFAAEKAKKKGRSLNGAGMRDLVFSGSHFEKKSRLTFKSELLETSISAVANGSRPKFSNKPGYLSSFLHLHILIFLHVLPLTVLSPNTHFVFAASHTSIYVLICSFVRKFCLTVYYYLMLMVLFLNGSSPAARRCNAETSSTFTNFRKGFSRTINTS